jgi:hypothetical protein
MRRFTRLTNAFSKKLENESILRGRASLHALQLCENPPEPAMHSGNGRWRD